MSDQLKLIVNELNKSPWNKNFNLISFDSLNTEQLLQVLSDVLAEVNPVNKVDVRAEDPEQTTVRIFEMLRILKYKPSADISPGMFRQGLVTGDKAIIHPILEWMLSNMEDVKQRAYLAQFLVRVEVPPEIIGDADMAALNEQYEGLMEDFKTVHRDSVAMKNSGYSTAELRADLEAMQREKDIVLSRIERMTRRVEQMPDREAMLAAAHALRLERERSKELSLQRAEQSSGLATAEQRLARLAQTLREAQQASAGASPEGLVQRAEEESSVATYIVGQKLPRELAARSREVEVLSAVLGQPALGRADLDALRGKIQEVNAEVNLLVQQHLATTNPADDKLAPFRQQAAIIASKKESSAEQLGELKAKLVTVEEELAEKQSHLQEVAGETVLRGEEFKRYVNKLRGRSSVYKRQRAELGALKAERGVLARTLQLLEARAESLAQGLTIEEARGGVAGVRDAEERLEQVSGEKASVDQDKARTLEEMSGLVLQLSGRVAARKAQLAPLLKELRPLRESCHELTERYDQARSLHDATAAGLESTTTKLQQEVRELNEELRQNQSEIHYLQASTAIAQVHLDRLSEEIRYYVSSNPGDKSRSLRDKLMAHLAEQERISRQLKEEQRSMKDGQTERTHQMKLWTNLQRLLECKFHCMEQAKASGGTVRREKGAETLVLQ